MLKKNPLIIIIATFFSFVGNGMHFIAISWLVYDITDNPLYVSVLVAFSVIPGIFTSFFAGTISDKFNRKKIMLYMDIFRGSIVFLLFTINYFSKVEIWHLFIATILITAASNFFFPALKGILKEAIPEDDFLRVVTANSTALQMGTILGAGLSGFLISIYSPYTVFFIDALTFFLSAILISFIQLQRDTLSIMEKENERIDFIKDFKIGIHYLISKKTLMFLYLMGFLPKVIFDVINSLLSDYTVKDLGLGAKEYGLLDATFALGSVLIGIYVVTFIKKDKVENIIYNYSFLGIGLSLFIIGFSLNFYMSLVGLFLLGITTMFEAVSRRTLIMKNIDKDLIGRVESFYWIIISTLTPLFAVFSGYFAKYIGTSNILSVLGMLSIILFLTAFKGGKKNFLKLE
ncbi:MFS transporter [Bacillus altitudinis]|uniref:MFS transporter n=1 Tax=Bacillus altitudinis TaxID=293387 RepID=UPI0039DF9648